MAHSGRIGLWRSRLAYWPAVASLAAITLAALLDDLGLADIVFVVLTLLPLTLLLKDRTWYLEIVIGNEQDNRAA